jgi:aminoglycoside phosphotransferase (APT) family kinase protein
MSEKWMDKATNIREGEELKMAALEAFLLENIEGASGKLTVDQFPGGASNLTYLLSLGEQQLVLRRPPFGAKIKSAHDMGREYKVLNALSKSYAKAPKPLIYTEDESVLCAPFYVMERVHGVILRSNKGPAAELDEKTIGQIADSLMETLVELHALDYEQVGLGDLGKPEGYPERQITGWTKRYFKAKTDEVPEIEKVAAWLAEHIPPTKSASLIHNDYKHDNVVLDPNDLTKIIAILDWEMCTLGDPLMDLGTSMAYWPNDNDPDLLKMAASSPSALPGNPSRGEMVQLYATKSGRDVGDFLFYYVYGLFKVAVVVQQIYARYKKGYTKDPRFANMNYLALGMCQMALRAIEKGRIDDLF